MPSSCISESDPDLLADPANARLIPPHENVSEPNDAHSKNVTLFCWLLIVAGILVVLGSAIAIVVIVATAGGGVREVWCLRPCYVNSMREVRLLSDTDSRCLESYHRSSSSRKEVVDEL